MGSKQRGIAETILVVILMTLFIAPVVIHEAGPDAYYKQGRK